MEVEQGEIGPKQKQNPTRQIQNPAPSCQASRNHKIMWAWLAWLALLFQLCHLQHSGLSLRQLHCLPAVFWDRHPMAMAFPTSTGFPLQHRCPTTASCTRFSVPLCPDFFYHTISVLRGSPEPWLKTLTPQSCVFCAYKITTMLMTLSSFEASSREPAYPGPRLFQPLCAHPGGGHFPR